MYFFWKSWLFFHITTIYVFLLEYNDFLYQTDNNRIIYIIRTKWVGELKKQGIKNGLFSDSAGTTVLIIIFLSSPVWFSLTLIIYIIRIKWTDIFDLIIPKTQTGKWDYFSVFQL